MDNEKTFTQEEVSRIVSKRLKEERMKFEKEFQLKEIKLNARAQLIDNGLDGNLADVLNLSDEETAAHSIKTIIDNAQRLKTQQPETEQEKPKYIPNGGAPVKSDPVRKAMGLPE